uniref:Uncharacterized protein n=1 Tax=viral metagenome TaxID=1070528 RepID=A0A6M3IN31_9ZZZZ
MNMATMSESDLDILIDKIIADGYTEEDIEEGKVDAQGYADVLFDDIYGMANPSCKIRRIIQ